MSTDSGDFTDVDEAQASSDYSFSPPPHPTPKELQFVHISPPTPPTFPTDDDDIFSSQPQPEDRKQSLKTQIGFVQKLYLQQQLRDNAVAFQRRQREQLELKDCTFQPNLHLRSPIRRPEEFIQDQVIREAKRMKDLEKQRKVKQEQRTEEERVRDRPHLSPGTQHIIRKLGERGPIIERLMSPKRTKELQPEISFAYHPLISPKAQKLKREGDVHEVLYRSKRAAPLPPPTPPFVAGNRSEVLVIKQLHRELVKACEEMQITGQVTREQFAILLKKLEFADDRDQALLDNCWAEIAGKEGTAVEMKKVVELLENAVGRKKGDEAQDKETRRTQVQFALMHKTRACSPSKYHQHEKLYTHQPAIDPASRAMSPPRANFLSALDQYQARQARHKASREQAVLSREASECSFAPKINSSKGSHPLLRRMKSMSPAPVALSETSSRHDILSQFGTLLLEERRLLPPPDHDYEDNKTELTFSPRRYASVRVRPLPEPSGYEKTVQRLQKANGQREEKERFLARGEGFRKQLAKEQ